MIQDSKPGLLNRLNRIAGQAKGVAKMVEDDRYCIDILTQIQAIRAALGKVEAELLRTHIDHCVQGAFTVGSSRVDLQACKLEYSIVSPK